MFNLLTFLDKVTSQWFLRSVATFLWSLILWFDEYQEKSKLLTSNWRIRKKAKCKKRIVDEGIVVPITLTGLGTNIQNTEISNIYAGNTFTGRNILSNDLNTNSTGTSIPWYSSWVKALIIVIICALIMLIVLVFNTNRLVLVQIDNETTKNSNTCCCSQI